MSMCLLHATGISSAYKKAHSDDHQHRCDLGAQHAPITLPSPCSVCRVKGAFAVRGSSPRTRGAGAVEVVTAKARVLHKSLGQIPRDGLPLHLWGVPKGLVPPPGGRLMNVRPVPLHDPVRVGQKALRRLMARLLRFGTVSRDIDGLPGTRNA
jgi:hypothetical protein